MNPRDAGYALAAKLVAGKSASALAEKAPRNAAAAIKGLLQQDQSALAQKVLRLRDDPSTLLEGIAASWIASKLMEEPQEVVDAVCRNLSPEALPVVIPELKRYGRHGARPGSRRGVLKAFDADLVERFCIHAFADILQASAASAPGTPEQKWVCKAEAGEIELVARECGLRSVARAFCRISRDDLAKLCHGLRTKDSVRLVGAVVELNEKLDAEKLTKLQATHLRLLRAAGVSPSLFEDTGLAFLGAAAVSRLDETTRSTLCYRLPEELGRRLLEVSAPGALPEESAIGAFQGELREWLTELAQKGIARSFEG
jgi:hypothetical protein